MSNFKKGDIIVYKHDIGVFTFAVTGEKALSAEDNGKVWRDLWRITILTLRKTARQKASLP